MGTGTSQGVPIIAQDPDIEIDLDNPKNWRTRCSVHVVMGGRHIQIDAAQEFRLQCIREKLDRIDDFILTHGHADHILGMDDMRRFCDLSDYGAIPVWSVEPHLQRIRDIYPYAIREKPEFKGYPAFILNDMPERLDWPEGTIETALHPHGRVYVLGLVFTEKATGKRLAYFTDCAEVTPREYAIAHGADVVVLDALRPQPHPTHMHTAKAIEAAQRLEGKRTFFTHLTCLTDHDRDDAALPEGIHYAYDGLRIEV